MIVKDITVENFQVYYGIQTIEFGPGLNLIIGKGGKGKSKLFNAFYWVFFGQIYLTDVGWCSTDDLLHASKLAMKNHEYINKKALSEASIDSLVLVKATIRVEDEKGEEYIIERSATAKRIDCDNWNSPEAWNLSRNILKVSFDSRTGTKFLTGDEALNKIDELFPSGIRGYIWFQGESLDELISLNEIDKLKNAVKHISYYPYYEKLSQIVSKATAKIESIERKKIKEANSNNAKLRGLLATLDNCDREKEALEIDKQKHLDNLSQMNIHLSTDESKISGLASYTGLVADYNTQKNELEKVKNEISSLDEFQRNQIPILWILKGIEPMLLECERIIKEHIDVENTTPEKKYLDNPSKAKLLEILKDGKCFVCGSDVSNGTPGHEWILNRLKQQEEYLKEMEEYNNNMQLSKQFNMFVGKIQDYPNSLKISVESIAKQWEESENKIESLLTKRNRINVKLEEFDKKIEDVKKKHGINPVEQARTAGILDSTIRVTRANIEKEQRLLDSTINALKENEKKRKNAESEIEKMGSSAEVVEVPETQWKNISIFLEDICKHVRENARIELLKKIEAKANEFYIKFTEHDTGHKGDIKIRENYAIEFDASLATSLETRKKMSIINALLALNQESLGVFYPFITDAPSSDLDSETTAKYLLGVKDIFKQSIVMTKDVDVNSTLYNNLIGQANVSNVYYLESKLYVDKTTGLEQSEVSTIVKRLK